MKEFSKWSWDCIAELLDGPLFNPRRLEEILRSTKFIKRLLAFYRPRKHRFSDIKVGRVSYIYHYHHTHHRIKVSHGA
jgi:rapamycin-insensitive companion of mTOR